MSNSSYGVSSPHKYASFGRRLGGLLIDGLIVGAVSIALTVLGFVAVFATPIPSGLIFLIVNFGPLALAIYLVVMVGKTGQSPGAKAVDIHVVDADTGQPIGPAKAIGRYLFGSFISGPVLLLGYFWMLWSPKKQTWHDSITNAVVIHNPAHSAVAYTRLESDGAPPPPPPSDWTPPPPPGS